MAFISKEELNIQKDYSGRVHTVNEGKNRLACVRTFGCQQNEADSEKLAGMLEEMGYTVVSEPDDCDLVIFNTCAVREHAEQKALSLTGQLKHLKAEKPDMILAICGCMVTQEHRTEDIKMKYPYVDILFGTGMLHRLPEFVYRAITEEKRVIVPTDKYPEDIAEGLPIRRESDFKAWVSIMYGCDNYCSYCVVPYVRGHERSRNREDVLEEVKQLVADGYREITLLGQNVNSYSPDDMRSYDFADLLQDICKIKGDFLVRFMTSHPKDATKKLIDTMAANPKIARQFHLPLQSGSNRILHLMNRRYTRESYLSLVKYMREKIPGIGLTTDIIVGFPDESEDDFNDTLDMLEKVKFDNIYSFIYSRRKGTPAADMQNQISPEVKNNRFERLLTVQNRISREINAEYIGRTERVLVEGRSKTDETKLTGRNQRNRLIHFEGPDGIIGKEADILITRSETYNLFGELKKDR